VCLLGCQQAQMTYLLRGEGPDPILFPPAKGTGSSQSAPSSIAIKEARSNVPEHIDCDISTDLISLRWQGTTANVSFRSQPFFTVSSDQSDTQIDHGMYIDPIRAIEKFHADLADRQSRGCLREHESELLRRAIVESLPLPPAIAYYVQLGSFDTTGYFDLTPDFRMQITSPIYPVNTAQSPENLLGYETANYSFLADGPDDRICIRLTSAIEVLGDGVPVEKQTLRNELPFSKSAGYFRLLFMTYETSSKRITRAILLSAPSKDQLSPTVIHRQVSPDNFCASVSTADVSCTTFPENFGVSPELRVRINRKDSYVRIGAMVQEVLGRKGPKARAPRSLRIFRPFQGRLIPIKFDHSSGDILRLVLLPGDEVMF
jgi:hypothetical protein